MFTGIRINARVSVCICIRQQITNINKYNNKPERPIFTKNCYKYIEHKHIRIYTYLCIHIMCLGGHLGIPKALVGAKSIFAAKYNCLVCDQRSAYRPK